MVPRVFAKGHKPAEEKKKKKKRTLVSLCRKQCGLMEFILEAGVSDAPHIIKTGALIMLRRLPRHGGPLHVAL